MRAIRDGVIFDGQLLPDLMSWFLRNLSGGLLLIGLALFSAHATGDAASGFSAYERRDFRNAYRILAPLATDANPAIQNFVGFMLYYGQGVPADARQAHDMFHRAAENGSRDSFVNLGVMHSKGAHGVAIDYREALESFAQAGLMDDVASIAGKDRGATIPIPAQFETLVRASADEDEKGKQVFLKFCAGCHGFDGFALLPLAPSFAMGDRLTKPNPILMASILNGRNLMPSWGDKLDHRLLERALAYLRNLAVRSRYGQFPESPTPQPERFYVFDPPGTAPGTNDWYLRK